MKLQTDSDIDGAIAKELRANCSLPQRTFWARVGVSQPAGHNYEAGRRIPKPVRTLLFLNYVAGIDVDTGSIEGAERARQLAASR